MERVAACISPENVQTTLPPMDNTLKSRETDNRYIKKTDEIQSSNMSSRKRTQRTAITGEGVALPTKASLSSNIQNHKKSGREVPKMVVARAWW